MHEDRRGDDRTALVVTPSSTVQVSRPLAPSVQSEVDAKKAKPRTASTLRAYRLDWKRFSQWCDRESQIKLPASEDTVVAYLLELSKTMMPSSLERSYATIRVIHDANGHTLPKQPGVYNALERIRRERALQGEPMIVRKRSFESQHVVAAVKQLPTDTLTGMRDRCVLTLGFALAQRRAQIADVKVEDVRSIPEGLEVTIRRSKTDQGGRGRVVPVIREGGPACPVGALEAWLRASGVRRGPLLRRIHKAGGVDPRGLSGDGIAQIVKAAARSIGLDPKEYGGHSLRRGFVTSAAKKGRDILAIMQTTGHTSIKTVSGYIDEGARVDRAAGRGLLAAPGADIEDDENGMLLFHRGEEAVTLGWVRSQVRALEGRGLSREKAVAALARIGVTKHKRPIAETDL